MDLQTRLENIKREKGVLWKKHIFIWLTMKKTIYIYVSGGSAVTYKKYYDFNYSLRNDTLLLFKSDKFLPPLVDFLKSRYKIPSLEIGRLVREENLINIKAKKVEGRIKIANNVVVSEFVGFDNLEVGRDYFVNCDLFYEMNGKKNEWWKNCCILFSKWK